jgi:hypothetical protein
MSLPFDPTAIGAALAQSWSFETSRQWTVQNPAAGQCNVTAIVIQKLFGGDILKTPAPGGDHFYNLIDGKRYDFTTSQFKQPIAYHDVPSDRCEAEGRGREAEVAALLRALRLNGAA